MKLEIDTAIRRLRVASETGTAEVDLYSPEAFQHLDRLWMKVGWALRYSYRFTWLGRPVVQLPEDLLRVQEAIFQLRPEVVIETGVAHGGSLVFYASLLSLLGGGRVIGVDIEIRPHNRAAIESHPLAGAITLVEGDSAAPATVDRVRSLLAGAGCVLVILDSNHTRAHVLRELEAYAPLVTPGSYVVVTDGVMRDLADVPGGRAEWASDNPCAAAADFLAGHPEFELAPPAGLFDESRVTGATATYWPAGWLRRRTS